LSPPRTRWSFRRPLALLVVIASLGTPVSVAGESPLQFLYIDANIGGSSGGHVAVKLGDAVYHFQNADGITRLTRDSWNRFRFVYNDLENRNIHIADASVQPADVERVRDRLQRLLMVQNRQIDYLDALRQDQALLEALRQEQPVPIPGIGFFSRVPHESSAMHDLQGQIEARSGLGYLTHLRERSGQQLASLAYLPPPVPDTGLEMDRYPAYPPTFSERFSDSYAHGFAVAAIQEGWPLADGRLIDASRDSTDSQLDVQERDSLLRYRDQLQQAIEADLEADYIGSGAALLLAIARYQAVSASLETGRLLLLDILPPDALSEHRIIEADLHSAFTPMLARLRKALSQHRRAFSAAPEPDEIAYNSLELAASETREIQRAASTGQAIRISRESGPPQGTGWALPSVRQASDRMDQAIETATKRLDRFRAAVQQRYDYELITRNCVTELHEAVHSSYSGPGDIRSALGDFLEPGARQGFIPFRFFELARSHYRLQSIRLLPSFRQRKLAAIEANDWLGRLRESNTLTARHYQPREGDSAFLLFTEDAGWARPVLGSVNLAYALGATTGGVVTAPFDRGSKLADGLRGILFSLPELAGWNIRKGSYDEMTVRAEP
jgi:hypothetical protein